MSINSENIINENKKSNVRAYAGFLQHFFEITSSFNIFHKNTTQEKQSTT